MWSEKAETPRWWWSSAPVGVAAAGARRRAACRPRWPRRPARRAPRGRRGRARSRRRRGRRRAPRGRPAAKPSTPAPASTTSPAASWPSAIGITRGREPSITERSEWQSPAARDPDQQLAGPGRVELELDDLERPRLGVGRGQPHLAQDGAADLHALPAPRRRSSARPDRLRDRRGLARRRDRRRRARTSRSASRLAAVGAEQPDLVADARVAQVPDPQPGLDGVGEGDRRAGSGSATRRRGRSPRPTWMSSPPSSISQRLITVSKNA